MKLEATAAQKAGDTITLPDAPRISGLTFRKYRGEADFPVMIDILDACNEADELEYVNTVDDIARLFAHLTNCDPLQDMLFAEVHGEPIAFSRVFWKDEHADLRLYILLGFVLPEWRRRGMGGAMLRYNERRLRRIARSHPAEMPKTFHAWATEGEPGAHALYINSGYRMARHFVEMTRRAELPLPKAPLPAGLEVRPVGDKHVRPIWDARQELFRDHWGYAPATEQDYQRWIQDPTFQPDLWQVAWHGDTVAGMVLNRIDRAQNQKYGRRRGRIQEVYVHRRWRRQGLARALLVQSIALFEDMGMEETAIGVDTQNPHGALTLYESLGFRPVKCHTFFRKALSLAG